MEVLGPLAAFGSSVTWAVGSGFYSRISKDHTSFAVNFTRASFALPLFLLTVFASAGGWNEGLAMFAAVKAVHLGWFTVSILASYAIGDSLFLMSAAYLGVPAALAISSSYPLWTAAIGFLVRGERMTVLQGFGLGVTVFGVVTVILSGARGARGAGEMNDSNFRKGLLLAFATSFLWATNSFSVSQGGTEITAPVANSIRMSMALALCFGMSRFLARGKPIIMPLESWKKWAWVFVFEAYAGSYFFIYGLAHSPLAIGSCLSSLAPVLSIPVAWALGVEKISPIRILGICAVVLGLSLLVGAGA